MSKRIHVYIEACASIDSASRFYWVTVGNSKQAMRDYLFLIAHAVSHGHFFERHSIEVAKFLTRVAASLGYSTVAELPFSQVDARELVRCIKKNEALPTGAAPEKLHQLEMLNSNYRFFVKCREAGLSACGDDV